MGIAVDDVLDVTYHKRLDIPYDGNNNCKIAIEIDGEVYMVKLPNKVESRFPVKSVSYITSSIAEHVGSKIYNSLDIETHETKLVSYNGQLCVACKDFTYYRGSKVSTLFTFSNIINNNISLHNKYISSEERDIYKVFQQLESSEFVNEVGLYSSVIRFYIQFIIDAIIGNSKRTNDDWGFLSYCNGQKSIAPVFDNDCLLGLVYNVDDARTFHTVDSEHINPFQLPKKIKSCGHYATAMKHININKIKDTFTEHTERILSKEKLDKYCDILVERYERMC